MASSIVSHGVTDFQEAALDQRRLVLWMTNTVVASPLFWLSGNEERCRAGLVLWFSFCCHMVNTCAQYFKLTLPASVWLMKGTLCPNSDIHMH